jgi:UPF0755 protein
MEGTAAVGVGARMRRRWGTGLLWLLLVLLVAAALTAGFEVWSLRRFAHAPLVAGEVTATVLLPPGESFRRFATRLSRQGLVASPRRLEWLARFRGVAHRVQAGEYEIHADQTPVELLEMLVAGRVKQYPFTVPEGLTCREIAARLGAGGLLAADAFVAATAAPQLLAATGTPGPTLEGYLLPETYQLRRGITAEELVGQMVAQMARVWTAERQAAADQLGLSRHQVLTLASIIEKETGRAEERPLISGVFHNRLRQGMRLQSDPTVIYAVEGFDGNLTRAHLETDTPYNTYTRHGLPPGPIANPGVAAIDAALAPTPTDALYFVSRNDGSHQFSTTMEEHLEAVDRYQLRRR